MRFAVAGGGIAGLAAALAVARAGHRAVVVERDAVAPADRPDEAFDVARPGIPHFLQPHSFLPRGRRALREMAPDVLEELRDAGAEEQDLSRKLRGPPEPGDEDLVYLWVRRPLIEWALRRAAGSQPGVELRGGRTIAGLITDDRDAVTGIALDGGETVEADVVVDALGRYRCPPAWPRAPGDPTDCGAVYYSRYFLRAPGVSIPEGPWLINPRGDLGYMGFNVFRGDNRTFAVILLVPRHDRGLRALRSEPAWMAACSAIHPLDAMTCADAATPITGVLPMGGLSNVLRSAGPGVRRVAPVGDALCHTDPSLALGLSFALIHADALARAAMQEPDPDAVVAAYLDAVRDEVAERHALAVATDAARLRGWSDEDVDVGHRDGCYPLFAFGAALAAAPYDDLVLRRTVGRVGFLERTAAFDDDAELHRRIEEIFGRIDARRAPRGTPARDELLARMGSALAGARR